MEIDEFWKKVFRGNNNESFLDSNLEVCKIYVDVLEEIIYKFSLGISLDVREQLFIEKVLFFRRGLDT